MHMLSYCCSMEFDTQHPALLVRVNCVCASLCLHVSAFATSTTSELIFTPAHTPPSSVCGGVLRAETEESDRACPASIKQHAKTEVDFIVKKKLGKKIAQFFLSVEG